MDIEVSPLRVPHKQLARHYKLLMQNTQEVHRSTTIYHSNYDHRKARKDVIEIVQTVDINVTVPTEILLSLRLENGEFATQMKVITAIKLYENHKLSIGQAAALAEMHEEDFIKLLGRNRISIFCSVAEIAEDYANA